MPAVSGDRFSGQNLSDCAFCPPSARGFRTQRQCSRCNRPLCLNCRTEVPGQPFLCPECGGGERDDSVHQPDAAIRRIEAAGATAPYWLVLHRDRLAATRIDAEEVLVPE